jgi:transposase
MLAFGSNQKVFLYGKPCDMRKGFNGLWGLVLNGMVLNPLCGYWFVFINGNRTHVKILHWEGDGIAVYYKRLEKGTFRRPSARLDSLNSELSSEELYLILGGIDFENTKKRKRFLSTKNVNY